MYMSKTRMILGKNFLTIKNYSNIDTNNHFIWINGFWTGNVRFTINLSPVSIFLFFFFQTWIRLTKLINLQNANFNSSWRSKYMEKSCLRQNMMHCVDMLDNSLTNRVWNKNICLKHLHESFTTVFTSIFCTLQIDDGLLKFRIHLTPFLPIYLTAVVTIDTWVIYLLEHTDWQCMCV